MEPSSPLPFAVFTPSNIRIFRKIDLAFNAMTVNTEESRRSTTPTADLHSPIRCSPRCPPRIDYRKKRARSSSSVGSTARYPDTQTCLRISIKASLINKHGETEYDGTGVFVLSERAHRSAIHARTRKVLADVLGVGLNGDPIDPVDGASRLDFEAWKKQHREDRRRDRKRSQEIAKLEAKLAAQRHERAVAEARAGKRKVGEPSGPPPGFHSPCSRDLEAVKMEEEESGEAPLNLSPQMRTRSLKTQPSGAPSDGVW